MIESPPMLPVIYYVTMFYMSFHNAEFENLRGFFDPKTGRVKFGNRLFPDIKVAIKYLGKR